MYITNQLTSFLDLSKTLSNSHIILTNLKSIILVASDTKSNYLNMEISNELKQILKLYSSNQNLIDYINTTMDTIIPICKYKDCCNYQSQIILPVVQNKILKGLLIFLSEKERYLVSNLNFAKTTKHFVEIFSTKNYL